MSSVTARAAPAAGTSAELLTAIYARISLDKREGAAGDRQVELCQERAEREGWPLHPRVFRDDDISASAYGRKVRPEYQALLAEVRAGHVNRILVWAVDRLYRQPKELEKLIDLAESGIQIVSVTAGLMDLNTPHGRAFARMHVTMSALESDTTHLRLLGQRRQARARGRHTSGFPGFGWKDAATPNETEVEILRDAWDRILAGETIADITRRWNRQRVSGKATWAATSVRGILIKPRHAGLVVHQGEVVGQATQWEPLLPREEWELIVATIRRRGVRTSSPGRRVMLSGLVYCACGNIMRRWTSPQKHAYWTCRRSYTQTDDVCGRMMIRVGPLEEFVERRLWRFADDMKLESFLTEDELDERRQLTGQIEASRSRESAAAQSYSHQRISLEALEQVHSDEAAYRAEREARRAELPAKSLLAPYAGRRGTLEAAWPYLTDDQKGTLIREAFGRITILANARPWAPGFDPSRVICGSLDPAAAATPSPSVSPTVRQTVEAATRLLAEKDVLTLGDVAQELQISKGTAHQRVEAAIHEGYLIDHRPPLGFATGYGTPRRLALGKQLPATSPSDELSNVAATEPYAEHPVVSQTVRQTVEAASLLLAERKVLTITDIARGLDLTMETTRRRVLAAIREGYLVDWRPPLGTTRGYGRARRLVLGEPLPPAS